jgi:hypothetical protein
LPKYGTVLSDFREEAARIMDAARAEGVLLRLIGAVAFSLHCQKFSHMQEMLGRSFSDLDFASYGANATKISKFFPEVGYEEDFMVTRLFGRNRLVFHARNHTNRHCDVFLDKLEFCHTIPFEGRLEIDNLTVPLAELLLEKMQIVKLTEKDAIDAVMLIREHEIGDSDNETIKSTYMAQLCAKDWGLWKTFTINLDRLKKFIADKEKLSNEDKKDINLKIDQLWARIDNEPKTTAWKLRARIGEKRKWYKDVEDVTRV